MKTHVVFLIITLLMISSLKAQVKIGDSPQNIDPASVLELESSNRVLVITRVTDSQMNAINPLPGALVYNTDAECIHYFNGTEWINICEALDNSFTTSTQAVFNTAPDSRDSTVVVTQTETPDGINYNFEVNRITGDNIYNRTIYGVDLAFGSISEAELQNGAVGLTKLAAGTAVGQLMQWDGTNWVLIPETDITVTEIDGVIGNEILDAADGTLVRSGAGDAGDPFVLDVAPLGIGNAELADDAVTTDKILDGTVSNADLEDDIITNTKMATNAIGTLELIDDSVDRDKIDADVAGIGLIQAADGSLEVDVASLTGDGDITSTDLNVTGGTDAAFNDVTLEIADDAITSAKILDGAVNTDDIADLAITNAKLGNGSISTGKIMTSAVNSAAIANNTIQAIDIADDAVTAAKINGDVAGSGLIQAVDGSLEVDVASLTGDGDITSTDLNVTGGTDAAFNDVTLEIADGAITSAKILDGTINTVDIADLAITNAKLGNGSISTGKIMTSAVNSAAIANNTIMDVDVAITAGIQGTKINPNFGGLDVVTTGNVIVGANTITNVDGTTGQVLTTDGAGNASWQDTSPTAVQTTGTIAGTGVAGDPLDLADDAVTTAKILDANVTNAKIADGSVNVAKIGTLGVADADRVLTTDGAGAPQWEPRANFASSTLTDGNIFVGDATNNAVGVVMSGDATITNAGVLTIEADAVNSAKIADGQVQTNDIADANVTPLKIQPGVDGQVLTTVGTATAWQAPAVVAMGKANAGTDVKVNGASVSSNGVGNYTVTFDVARLDADYIVQLTLLSTGGDVTIEVTNQGTNSFDVRIWQLSAPLSTPGPLTSTAVDAEWFFTVTDF
ncbi:beta strand repeat-containing protein [Flagellimonas iocasae]|uniref:Beta strand repeat-containing protein n=1 Tax=Flagellimonas iocasae TaxID=2055905 RepID=A0ABW4Y030_9FLAO